MCKLCDEEDLSLEGEFIRNQRMLFRRTLKRVGWCLLALLLILASRSAFAAEKVGWEEKALVTFHSAGQETPVGGVGVYDGNDYGRRVGTIETLGDGSTVLRGDYGRVEAKVDRYGNVEVRK